jgi:hypothetical protein
MFAKLSEYLDQELDEATCEDIRRHAESCVPCEACLETLRRTVDLCHQFDQVPVPEDFSRRLKEMVDSLIHRSQG